MKGRAALLVLGVCAMSTALLCLRYGNSIAGTTALDGWTDDGPRMEVANPPSSARIERSTSSWRPFRTIADAPSSPRAASEEAQRSQENGGDGTPAPDKSAAAPASSPAPVSVGFGGRRHPPRSTPSKTNFTSSRYAGGGEGGRFPARGTDKFARECGWTMVPPPTAYGECNVLVRPTPNRTEGISDWLASLVNSYVIARQSGCRLRLDYGPGVDIRRVLEPLTDEAAGTGPNEGLYDWSVPADYDCREKDMCFLVRIPSKGPFRDATFVAAPSYRLSIVAKVNQPDNFEVFNPNEKVKVGGRKAQNVVKAVYARKPPQEIEHCLNCLYDDSAAALQRRLPGFRLETGFACAFANLLRPAPTAAEYEPRLFAEILPALRDPDALVISVYLRTGQTEGTDTASLEERKWKRAHVMENPGLTNVTGSAIPENVAGSAMDMFDCAISVEGRYLTGEAEASGRGLGSYSKVVWMVLTDAPQVKEWAVNKYSGPASVPSYQRKVLVTGARGVHTRTRRNTSTAEFAEGILDWYLIGESDVVILNGPSFGATAAFRTARPMYHVDNCARRRMIHKRTRTSRR